MRHTALVSEGSVRGGQVTNLLLRLAAAAAGLALTRRLATMPESVGAFEVGFLGGLYSAMELLAAIPAGALSDQVGRRSMLVAGAAAGAAGLLITGTATQLPLLALGRLVQGLGTGCTIPPLLGWFSDVTASRPAGSRGRVMAGVEAGTAAGLLGGTVLGSLLWDRGRANSFPLLAVPYLLAAALVAITPSVAGGRTDRIAEGRLAALRQVLRTPGMARLLSAWVLLNSVVGLWLTHAVYQLDAPATDPVQFLVGRLHGNALSGVLAAWTLLFIAGSLAWGPVLGRLHPWQAMRIALGGMLVVCASLVGLNAGWLPEAVRWACLPIFCSGVVLEAGFAPAALSQLAADASAAHRGLTMGLYSVALGLGILIGSWAGSPFSHYWAMNGIIGATALLAAGALAVLALVTPGRPTNVRPPGAPPA